MGEQPLFSCKAHVFQLEPEHKKSWIGLSTTAVNVQIFHDPIKGIYRIVSVEGSKALINSVVTSRMTFTKTSQKFGQWIDFKLNLVYGLGFANDVELNKFVDKFKEIKELTRHSSNQRPHERSNSCEINSIHRPSPHSISSSNHTENASSSSDMMMSLAMDMQTKQDNDKLRLALVQSTSNQKKIEEELHILKNNNMRLTNALQESHSNLDEWKKQLQFYKDECYRLKTQQQQHQINDAEMVTSSSSSNLFKSHQISNGHSSHLKQDLTRLADQFDKKFTELLEIRDELKKLISSLPV